jgi:hypothetical protein
MSVQKSYNTEHTNEKEMLKNQSVRIGMVQIEGAHIAEVTKLMEYVDSKEDPLIKSVRIHQYHKHSTLLETVKNFKKSFQSGTNQVKNIISQNIKENWEEKGWSIPK